MAPEYVGFFSMGLGFGYMLGQASPRQVRHAKVLAHTPESRTVTPQAASNPDARQSL